MNAPVALPLGQFRITCIFSYYRSSIMVPNGKVVMPNQAVSHSVLGTLPVLAHV